MFIEIPAVLLPVLGGVLLAGAVSRGLSRPRRTATIAAAAVLGIGVSLVYDVGVITMPFLGWASEVPLFLATAVALVPSIVMFQLLAPDTPGTRGDKIGVRPSGSARSEPPWRGSLLIVLFILPIAMVVMPWTGRIAVARMRAWACDGPILSKYHSSNHRVPTVEVGSAAGPVKLEGVDARLWDGARVGDRLVKRKSSATGTLNGQRVRVVPPWTPWEVEGEARPTGAR
jgi:hypothetical protein